MVFVAPLELVAKLEKHRERLDEARAEGTELTSMGAAIRNMLDEGYRAIEAREAGKR
jgi:hypothetical protein